MKTQKCEYLENEQSFFDEIKKTFFIVFKGLSFGEKKERFIKILQTQALRTLWVIESLLKSESR